MLKRKYNTVKLNKFLKEKNNTKYEPQLIELGAIYKAPGIYELDGFFLYPTKAFAMCKTNPRKRMRLSRFIKKKKYDKF